MHFKFVPIGAIGRVLAVVAVTAVLGLVANTLLLQGANRFSIREEEARRASEHIVVVARILEDESLDRRAKVVEYTSTAHFKLAWIAGPAEPGNTAVELVEMHSQMVIWEPTLRGKDLRLHLAADDPAEVIGWLKLSDGSWLRFRAQDLVGVWKLKLGQIVVASLPMLALVLIAMTTLRSILHPLRLLADAVARVGKGDSIVLEEQGPREFRRLIRAYNDMQARIAAMIKDRTEALAAVGHDLRTPLSRLRLHADSVTDAQTRGALIRDMDEMEQMLESLLTFFRGDAHSERKQLVDLAVMASTVVDDLQDRGFDITYVGPQHCDTELRPVEFKRALSNLAENACHYGSTVVVHLMASDRVVRIRVEDDGPGVPEEDLQKILVPFQRLDLARRRNTAGVGLGLPIAARVVAEAGGNLTLSNRSEGGLCAEIELPRPARPAMLRHKAAAD
jgi:two-component system, OmpR family, osmolarity sensor histidine kinase EnvZ